MKENEFDIQVRNLLQNAEEDVSPKIWEGVAAGLDKKHRVVRMRFWGSLAGAAAAAAVVAGVVLFPRPVVIEDHSNPIITIAEAPVTVEETTTVTELKPQTVAPVRSPRRTVRLAQDLSAAEVPAAPAAPAAVEDAEEEEPVVIPAREAVPAPADAAALLEDQAQFNRLAFAESRETSGRGLSVDFSGNLQDKRRVNVPGGVVRPYSAPPLYAQEGIYNESPEVSFSLPFSVGAGLKYNFSPRWGVGVGLRYTNLSRTFVGDYLGEGFLLQQTDIDNHQHWLGIPVHAYYNIVNRGRWRVHAFAGAGVELLLDNDFLIHGSHKDIHYHQKSTRPQWSGDLGLGVEFKITPLVGIYLDPSFRYYFRTDLQPRSLRTIQPLRFDIEAGVRFSFGEK